MSIRNPNSAHPAFPDRSRGYDGLTKLEYFAAHAPPVAEWFVPTGIPPKPVVPELPPTFTAEERNEWWQSESSDEAIYSTPRLKEYAALVDQRTRARDAWTANRRWQVEIQWRWEYARMMLEGQPT
jgi:hypothetical protein